MSLGMTLRKGRPRMKREVSREVKRVRNTRSFSEQRSQDLEAGPVAEARLGNPRLGPVYGP